MKKCFYISEMCSSELQKKLSLVKDAALREECRGLILETSNETLRQGQIALSCLIKCNRIVPNFDINNKRVQIEKTKKFQLSCIDLSKVSGNLTEKQYKSFCDAVDIYYRGYIPNFEIIKFSRKEI